jgi:hypothetical protein
MRWRESTAMLGGALSVFFVAFVDKCTADCAYEFR